MHHIGLDWGTNYISVGVSRPNADKPEAFKFRDTSKEKKPSLLYYSEHSTMIGESVELDLYQSAQFPPNDRLRFQQGIVRSLKRQCLMNPTGAHMIPGKGLISYRDIIRDVFAYVKQDTETGYFCDEPVSKVTLTHPVSCSESYKDLIRMAALEAGFKEVELMEEPVAAAIGYASSGAKVGKGILVYDYGGGTFDVAFVLKDDNGEFRPLHSMGDSRCGGDDLDMRLYEHWDRKAQKELGRPITDKKGEVDIAFLLRCRNQKEALSSMDKKECVEYLPSLNASSYSLDNRLKLTLDQTILNQLFIADISHTIDITQRVLSKVEEDGYSVDTVILIGGSSRWPLIKELLKSKLPVAPLETMNSDVAVAMGAVCRKMTKNLYEIYQQNCQKLLSLAQDQYEVMQNLKKDSILHDDIELERILSGFIEKLKTDKFKILVDGRFGSGKSTFINALLGQTIFSLSGVFCEVKFANDNNKKAFLYPKKGMRESGNDAPFEIDTSNLQEEFNKYHFRGSEYEKLELFWPIPILKNGIELIELVAHDHHCCNDILIDSILNYAISADIILYCMSSAQACSNGDKETSLMWKSLGHDESLFFIFTGYDMIRACVMSGDISEADFQRYVRNTLTSWTELKEIHIHYVDSRSALSGKIQKNEDAIEDSGIHQIEKALEIFLVEKRGRAKLIAALKSLLSINQAVRQIIPAHRSMLLEKNIDIALKINDFIEICGLSHDF